jgi:glycosyltransferase involved in cell wall biosynthesis
LGSSNNILMVLDSIFPPDIRLEKEIPSLEAAGFSVTVLCRGTDAPSGARPDDSKFVVRTLDYRSPKGLHRRLADAEFLLTQQSTVWANAIRSAAKMLKPIAIHVHDLPLVLTALKVADPLQIPVVADLHENYPAAVGEWRRHQRGLIARLRALISSYDRWLATERHVVNRVAHVIAVVEEMKSRLITTHDLRPDRVTVISNTEPKSFARDRSPNTELLERYRNSFTLLYIGGFGPHRGLDTAIRGVSLLRDKIPNVLLLLVGRGSASYEKALRSLADETGASGLVEIVGWQPFEAVFSYMCAARIGLVPHNSSEHTENTVPHKLFQYMLVGLPVLASTCAPLARICTSTGGGFTFAAGDPQSFAEKVIWAHNHPQALAAIGNNGQAATLHGDWNWEATAPRLVEIYQRLR